MEGEPLAGWKESPSEKWQVLPSPEGEWARSVRRDRGSGEEIRTEGWSNDMLLGVANETRLSPMRLGVADETRRRQ